MITPDNVFKVILCTLLICITCLLPSFIVAYEYGIAGGLLVYILFLIMTIISYAAIAVHIASRKSRLHMLKDIVLDTKSSFYEIPEIDADIFIIESSGKLLLNQSSFQC